MAHKKTIIAAAIILVVIAIALKFASRSSAPPAAAAPGNTRWYADTSFWNTPIPSNPVIDPNSAAMVASAVVPFYHAFINSDEWGYPYVTGTDADPVYTVICTTFCPASPVPAWHIPEGALPSSGSDHHLAVINGDQELDLWLASYNAASGTWSAGATAVNDLHGWGAMCAEGNRCSGAVAAGFALLGGAIRPEEIAEGRIDHALALATPETRTSYVACPATNTDGTHDSSAALPEGAHIQLDPSFDVDAQSWPPWEKEIAKALQIYGGYIADTSGIFEVRGVTDQNAGNMSWASVGVPKAADLKDLPWNRMRVLKMTPCL